MAGTPRMAGGKGGPHFAPQGLQLSEPGRAAGLEGQGQSERSCSGPSPPRGYDAGLPAALHGRGPLGPCSHPANARYPAGAAAALRLWGGPGTSVPCAGAPYRWPGSPPACHPPALYLSWLRAPLLLCPAPPPGGNPHLHLLPEPRTPETRPLCPPHLLSTATVDGGRPTCTKTPDRGAVRSRPQGPENNLYAQYEERVRPCIDLIDSLRALGVEQDLALPAIAVIGDQSSGKSSVLEALSGVPLPRGNGIITRCPLELKMKKQPWASRWRATVSYRDVRLQLDSPSQVEKEIRKAQKALTGSDTSISQELITLEVTSCEVPDLTLIDLPGIARLAIGGQPRDIGEQIKALIRKYIQRQETINLVVVPSNVDIATTEALSMAREVDPDGDRTIGVLTKPDLVDRGTEKGVLQVAQNLTYHLKKGYMMVRCRAQQEVLNNLSCAEAAKREMQFFEVHPHFRVLLDNGMATVPRLAERLTEELSEHISVSRRNAACRAAGVQQVQAPRTARSGEETELRSRRERNGHEAGTLPLSIGRDPSQYKAISPASHLGETTSL
uniref:Interferon-induced GTP-binding protein Mx2 n=1 Tax=Oryctolagus cuniculus TaxID=9986 RepID=G1TLY6_RABIT